MKRDSAERELAEIGSKLRTFITRVMAIVSERVIKLTKDQRYDRRSKTVLPAAGGIPTDVKSDGPIIPLLSVPEKCETTFTRAGYQSSETGVRVSETRIPGTVQVRPSRR